MDEEFLDNSFDEQTQNLDINSVIAEFPNGDDQPGCNIPIKKLSVEFDNFANPIILKTNLNDDVTNNLSLEKETNMKVFIRIRPTDKTSDTNTITVLSDTTIVTNAPESSKRAQYTKMEERHYSFTRVFGPNSSQSDIFGQVTEPLLDRFIKGESCVLFAYGMTNAGKTHTIQGTTKNQGILPRLVSGVLEKMETELEDGCEWNLETSMFEIYQEKIYDLLGTKKENLKIRDANGTVQVCKLSSHCVSSATDSIKLMDVAATRRTKSQTLLNISSSRSHAVYMLTLIKKDSNGKETSIVFQVVDLAGAERSNRTKGTAAQQKEANNINMSLMQLWRCLQGMKKTKSDVSIPFRESKLTHLLMPLLSRTGLQGVSMIACVNPRENDYDETLSVLGNASIACKIKEIADLGRIASQPNIPRLSKVSIDSVEEVNNNNKSKPVKRGRESNNTKPINNLKRSSKSEITIDNSHRDSHTTDSSSSIENKKLRLEIQRLESYNSSLLHEQIQKETEIRIEVSEEMALRSQHLLNQIEDLQEQLYSRENHVNDIKKSCKKARKNQVELANADAAKDLQEAEEELERVKAKYEVEINYLKSEKVRLEAEVLYWRQKSDSRTSTGDSVAIEKNNISIKDEFSLRMQRHQHKKEEEIVIVVKKSPSRSPLSNVQNSPNSQSPLRQENGIEKPVSTRIASPLNKQRPSSGVTDENSPKLGPNGEKTYLKRLRSHFIRG
jgi:hypothetical protein